MNSRLQFVVGALSTSVAGMLLFGALYGQSSNPEEPYRHIAVYTEVLSRIKSDYVEEPDVKGVTLGAINGLLESLDPYASYLTAEHYKQYLKTKDQQRPELGLVLSRRFGYVSVVSAMPGSPASKAGLTTGDVIEAINNVSTRDMPLAFADMLLKGDSGTTVELQLLRARRAEPQKLTLIRANVPIPAVTAKMMPDHMGYVQVSSLAGNRVKDVAARVEELQKQGAKNLILDLRFCATGNPEDGIKLANLFVDKGLLTYLQGQKVAKQEFTAIPASVISKLPIAVLVNRGTANGAEVAAAALQDSKRATVVGERTYGDAAQRKAITLDDGSAVILSVAKYYSPSGKAIQDNGVTPTVLETESDLTPESDEDEPETSAQPQQQQQQKPTEDRILKKAIETLSTGKMQAAA
jgi:carboxyl-terminal processing protease